MDEKTEKRGLEPRPSAVALGEACVRGAGGHPLTVSGEELLQVLLRARVGQVSHKEPPGVTQVFFLFILPKSPALPGFAAVLQGPFGQGNALFPEYLDVAPTCARGGVPALGAGLELASNSWLVIPNSSLLAAFRMLWPRQLGW